MKPYQTKYYEGISRESEDYLKGEVVVAKDGSSKLQPEKNGEGGGEQAAQVQVLPALGDDGGSREASESNRRPDEGRDQDPRVPVKDQIEERADGGPLQERGGHEQGEAVPLLVLGCGEEDEEGDGGQASDNGEGAADVEGDVEVGAERGEGQRGAQGEVHLQASKQYGGGE